MGGRGRGPPPMMGGRGPGPANMRGGHPPPLEMRGRPPMIGGGRGPGALGGRSEGGQRSVLVRVRWLLYALDEAGRCRAAAALLTTAALATLPAGRLWGGGPSGGPPRDSPRGR